jgi:L-threonylcarbamoyladenylate synthase
LGSFGNLKIKNKIPFSKLQIKAIALSWRPKLAIFAHKYTKMSFLEPLELKRILDNLNIGGTMLYPSDTLWALGCDAENEAAIDKIIRLKEKKEAYPMVVLVGSLKMLLRYVPQLGPKAGDLIEYYEKPLTILYDNCQLPDKLKASDGTTAIRVVKEASCASIINTYGKAIVSTIASATESQFPNSFEEVPDGIKKGVDYIAKFDKNHRSGKASTIIRINSKNELIFLRKDY